VIVVCFVASAVAISLGESGMGAALAAAGIHALLTAGRASLSAYRATGVFGRRLLFVVYLVIAVALFFAGFVGGLLGADERLHALVPSVDGLVDNLWTAVLAGVFGAYTVRATSRSEISIAEIIGKSTERLPIGTLEYADAQSAEYDVDPLLLQSLLLVENLQRPRWIRQVERALGRVLPVGSYGLMQVQTDQPVTDEESIRLAAQRLAGKQVRRGPSGLDSDQLIAIIRSYNGNVDFIALAASVYYELDARGEPIS
jgi:hypothetical protein